MTEKRQANKKIKKDTARQIALEVICAVIDGGAYANIALNKTLRMKKTDDRDRRFITELVYGTIKQKVLWTGFCRSYRQGLWQKLTR